MQQAGGESETDEARPAAVAPEPSAPSTPAETGRGGWLVAVLFLCLVPAGLHLAYSWIGFNPTDEGFILALSRRLLEGEVPHRDFCFIRPAGSPMLHVAVLAVGKDHCLLLSRFVFWLQLAVISWIWMRHLGSGVPGRWGPATVFATALMGVLLDAHLYPMMAWYTIDGLFLAAIGLDLMRRKSPGPAAGAFLLGFAALCKQNFLLAGVATILLTGHARNRLAWLMLALPWLLYLGALGALGILPAFVTQITAETGLFQFGILPFIVDPGTPWGIALGLGVLDPLLRGVLSRRHGASDPTWPQAERLVILIATIWIVIAHASRIVPTLELRTWCHLLYGVVLGLTAGDVVHGSLPRAQLETRVLLVITAWCACVSRGYSFPALISGSLVAAILTRCRPPAPDPGTAGALDRAIEVGWKLAIPGLLLAALVQHHHYRTVAPTRDLPVTHLTRPLGEVLRGGAGIMTNEGVYAMLADLKQLVDKLKPARVAVIPDIAAWWIRSSQPNPLPLEWPLDTETPNFDLSREVSNAIYRQRGATVFLVQKYPAEFIQDGKVPAWPENYSIVGMVRSWMTRTGESEYFEIYQ